MGRHPPSKKNQHNTRHENGLVGPGKRVTKQKSNGQLNGSPKAATPDEPLPDVPLSNVPMTDHPANVSSSSLSESKPEHFGAPRVAGLRKRNSESSYDGREDGASGSASPRLPDDEKMRRHDITPSHARFSQEVSTLHFASTILRSCPAYDTIALLIFLLSVPSTILTVVQALFASLTFTQPSGITLGSMLSLFDIFQGSAGAPSLGTMVVVDVLCFGLWFCLWPWAQHLALDFAQIQIAITLGGNNSGKSSGVNVACFAIVLILDLARSRGVRNFFFSHLLTEKILTNPRIAKITSYLPPESEFGSTPKAPPWIRSLFAVHIVTQALMAFVRRRIANSQSTSATRVNRRADGEAGGVVHTQLELPARESEPTTAIASGTDHQPPPTPGLKDTKDKGLSAKKRRRQANQVRSRQPFWAAVATTKVTVVREYENQRGGTRGASHKGDVDATFGQESVWITHVDRASIQFEATNIYPPIQHAESDESTPIPFFVRINGARWDPVSFEASAGNVKAGQPIAQWSGEISGLAPDCTYTCSFVRFDDGEEFASIMVKTPALLEKDLSNSTAPAPPRSSFRPSSPNSTLKTSILTSEAKLNDARNRLQKLRRTHKAALSKIEREVEAFNSRLKSSGDDAKQRQKLLQAERNIRQTEDATDSISEALNDLAAIPEDDTVDYTSRKDAFQKQSGILAAANESLSSARASAKNEISCVNSELSTVTTRKERLVSRQAKLAEHLDRITQANVQGLNEKERKEAESKVKEAAQQKMEANFQSSFAYFRNEIASLQSRTQQAWHEVQAYEKQSHSQRDMMMANSTSFSMEPSMHNFYAPQIAPSRYNGFNGFPPAVTMSPEQASPFMAYAKTLPTLGDGRRPRSETNRSSGAASRFSLDFDDADPIPPMPTTSDFTSRAYDDERKDSDSSRGHSNDSPGVIGTTTNIGSPLPGPNSPGRALW